MNKHCATVSILSYFGFWRRRLLNDLLLNPYVVGPCRSFLQADGLLRQLLLRHAFRPKLSGQRVSPSLLFLNPYFLPLQIGRHIYTLLSLPMMRDLRQPGACQSVEKCGSTLPEPTDPSTEYWPHYLNGGAVSMVSENLLRGGWKKFEPTKVYTTSANRGGLCDDPVQGEDHMIVGTFLSPSYENVPVIWHWKTGGLLIMWWKAKILARVHSDSNIIIFLLSWPRYIPITVKKFTTFVIFPLSNTLNI